VERLKQEGIDVGLINKPTLNVVDEEIIAKVGSSPFVLVVEAFNRRTGLGSRYGSWLLERLREYFRVSFNQLSVISYQLSVISNQSTVNIFNN